MITVENRYLSNTVPARYSALPVWRCEREQHVRQVSCRIVSGSCRTGTLIFDLSLSYLILIFDLSGGVQGVS